MARFAAALVALIAFVPQGAAAAAPFTPALSCRAAAGIVAARGAVVLATGGDLSDRYVSNQGQCYRDEDIKPAWVRAADSAACFVGYTCEHVFSSRK